ncbi:uncharacterized protein LOC106131076 isoform X1 [Amyelois transitella]|uniref:uncharacterized protein LOC106131076 isoform X1 n=2 Tax=Amyelois transitella TaxID=680683 RepID=UPI0029907A19|nr:uncharacterized protein LOC106131076 isoform X1 [Amyelois transitella]XP_060800847.1 uncharacterized protein LOC106131076 isoform X1 [Amyelois transitella]XP_060800848.1 uncharacterized protein LOC106131076 isoform X1 [Amyelois transitella]
MAGRGPKKEIDPEELMRKKFKAKCQFRALGRLVMANTYWLIEAVDHYEGVEDVKRRVEQAVRGKAKKKQLLTIHDKALLNKPAEERTDQEKKYLYRIIGGLKCFKRYPNHVKKKLAAVTYFKYYSPGRAIVRQHHEAHALYFIVTGDVVVSQLIYDELIQQYVSVDVGVMHPGDMFGEVSLLHNIPRTATCTTSDHCELLALMKEDFKNVLLASVQKQWDEVRDAMSAFTYFDALDEVARREGCIVAKMKSYDANETLLGDGVGVANFVYFILSGRCQMVESIQVITKTHLGRNSYTLYDPYIPVEESEQDFDEKYFGAYKNLNKGSKESRASAEASGTKQDKPSTSQVKAADDQDTSGILKSSMRKPKSSAEFKPENEEIVKEESKAEVGFGVNSEVLHEPSGLKEITSKPLFSREGELTRESVRLSVLPEAMKMPPNVKTYFMQVCQLNPGASFGFGENMRDRRIVALTPVDCMLMPKIWLLQKNTANIWTRIQHYLEKKIPTKKQLFKEFVSQRRWQDFRNQMVDDVVSRSNTVNWTSVHDVPYSIRMEEMLDI